MQTKDELEEWYSQPDPWEYETNPDDSIRKEYVLAALEPHWYQRALDVGCGEGWITKDLPARVIHGLELSDTARERIPEPVIAIETPTYKYDLIILTGVLYEQYDYRSMMKMVKDYSRRGTTVLTCHIKDWEQELPFKAEYVEEFPYRGYIEVLRRYVCE